VGTAANEMFGTPTTFPLMVFDDDEANSARLSGARYLANGKLTGGAIASP
jgi:hypothetical protein